MFSELIKILTLIKKYHDDEYLCCFLVLADDVTLVDVDHVHARADGE